MRTKADILNEVTNIVDNDPELKDLCFCSRGFAGPSPFKCAICRLRHLREYEGIEVDPSFKGIGNIKKGEDEDTLFGTMELFQVSFHCMFIKVHRVNGVQEGTNDPHCRLDDAYKLDSDVCFQTVEVPGFEGEWVLVIHPFGD